MQKLLIVGYGDIGARTAALLSSRYRIYALTRGAAAEARARRRGAVPVSADLDHPITLRRIAGLADAVLHFAPPPQYGERDRRTRNLAAALGRGKSLPQRLVYISTTGVYGDCQGDPVEETRPVNPGAARSQRRVDAENVLRKWGAANGIAVSILRVPGIYAPDRLPLRRLNRRDPALHAEDDCYTNHIHADDLARVAAAALMHGRPGRVYNAADDTPMKMADYLDMVADHCGLERPPRISRVAAQQEMAPGMLSYLAESRRISNHRMRRELEIRLHYPGVIDGLNSTSSKE